MNQIANRPDRRARITTEIANSPSWAGDSRHVLYQSMDALRIVDVESGETSTVPLDLTYTLGIPKDRVLVHAGRLIDMKSDVPRAEVDILIDGHRIRSACF